MMLFDKLEKFNSKIAIIDENSKKYNFKQLIYYSDKIGNKFKKRTPIFLICENR